MFSYNVHDIGDNKIFYFLLFILFVVIYKTQLINLLRLRKIINLIYKNKFIIFKNLFLLLILIFLIIC